MHVHEVHEVKELVHNLASAITKCAARLKNRVDFECPDHGEKHRYAIHDFSEVCADFVHICECVEYMCDHRDGSLYHHEDGYHDKEVDRGGLGAMRKHA